RYKATMMHQLTMCNAPFHPAVNSSSSNSTFLDLTGGFGVDTAFLSDLFGTTVYVERQPELCAIAQSNFATLGKAITTVCGDATDCLRQQQHVALIFLDPARRDNHGDRTYGIADCTPNVLPLLPELLQKADHLLLKLSPMLDWRKAVADVGPQHVEQVHIVAVHGECKELLLLLSAQGSQAPSIICANDDSREEFTLTADDFPTSPTSLISLINPNGHAPLFLYEPNAALMKAGLFAQLALRYGIEALAPNSHLFASSHRVDDFPGRSFLLTAVSTMNKQELRSKVLPLKQANITVRNFPLSVAELRKRLKLREGGSNYVFATTLATGDKVLLVCQRLL
ncbi:MAG: SAM-dependent methyltransferase, partial [Prevotella sp.]|nr:SAM-dependent methyltransferase [Prevotella sp.]